MRSHFKISCLLSTLNSLLILSLFLLLDSTHSQIIERFYSQKIPPHLQKSFKIIVNEFQDDQLSLWKMYQDLSTLKKFSPPVLQEILQEKSHILSDDEGFFANVTSDLCKAHMEQFFLEFISFGAKQPSTWALQMIDSWGKLPDGILSGHTSSLGDFQECLQLKGNHTNGNGQTSDFRGRYCLAYVLPQEVADEATQSQETNLNEKNHMRESLSPVQLLETVGSTFLSFLLIPQFANCFPDSCSHEDSQQLLNNFDRILNTSLVHYISACQTEEKPSFDAAAIIMIIVLSTIVALCIVGTLADILLYQKAPVNSFLKGTWMKTLVAFSVYTNTLKWLNTDSGKGVNLGCLHGLRFLSMAWVVLGHSWQAMGINQSLWNTVDFISVRFTLNFHIANFIFIMSLQSASIYKGNWTLMAIFNGTLSVDTFFVISGTLASFHIFKALDKSKGRLNVPLLYVHRYLRLTPTYMILVGVVATLLPYFGSGPNWQTMENEGQLCRDNWWHNLLYITNLIKYPANSYSCYSESWYLSNDMQFFIVAPFIILPIWHWKKIGLAILGLFHLGSFVIPTVIKATQNLPPTVVLTIDQGDFSEEMYNPPWTRMGPYVVGITLGYILYLEGKSKHRKIPNLVVLFLWLLFTGVALAVIFGVQRYFDPANLDKILDSPGSDIYGGFNRYVWGVVIAWIIYACINGYGGWVNDFLCWKPFIPLGRLTFCVYMSSLHMQMLFHLTTLHPWHYSVYTTVNMFFAHLVMALLVGYVLTMTIESPFMQLEKLIFPEQTRRPARHEDKSNERVENGRPTTTDKPE